MYRRISQRYTNVVLYQQNSIRKAIHNRHNATTLYYNTSIQRYNATTLHNFDTTIHRYIISIHFFIKYLKKILFAL